MSESEASASSPASGTDQQASRSSNKRKLEDPGGVRKPCHCTKSKCLKLYCDCFGSRYYCSPACACVGCGNTPEYKDQVRRAVESTLTRNPKAFQPKITDEEEKHTRGCRCKNSFCLKNYCECFQAGVVCGDNCKCHNCKNLDGNLELEFARSGGMKRVRRRNAQKQKASRSASKQGSASTPKSSDGAHTARRRPTKRIKTESGAAVAVNDPAMDPSSAVVPLAPPQMMEGLTGLQLPTSPTLHAIAATMSPPPPGLSGDLGMFSPITAGILDNDPMAMQQLMNQHFLEGGGDSGIGFQQQQSVSAFPLSPQMPPSVSPPTAGVGDATETRRLINSLMGGPVVGELANFLLLSAEDAVAGQEDSDVTLAQRSSSPELESLSYVAQEQAVLNEFVSYLEKSCDVLAGNDPVPVPVLAASSGGELPVLASGQEKG
jgi:Tesmin/TSO1-like CXC domain, cysteine-rich domain